MVVHSLSIFKTHTIKSENFTHSGCLGFGVRAGRQNSDLAILGLRERRAAFTYSTLCMSICQDPSPPTFFF